MATTTRTTTDVALTTTALHHTSSGVVVRHVEVTDLSDEHPDRDLWFEHGQRWDRLLRERPELGAPVVRDGRLEVHNEASRWLYSSPGMREWRRDLVPSARALLPMQRPLDAVLPSGARLDAMAFDAFVCSLDGIGIRTRAAVMREIITRREEDAPRGDERPTWVSLACGAAVPVLDAAAAVTTPPRLHLVDLDAVALDFARDLARAQGLVEGVDLTVSQRDLVRTIIALDGLVEELGEASAAVVDARGLFEYFSSSACVRLLRNAYRLLEPGGVLVVANMLADRPQLAMNQRGVGWPAIHPRSVEELVHLVAQAGLPLSAVTVHLPEDGVYAVVEVTRPGAEDVIDLRGR